MSSLNKAQLIGRLGKDVELKHANSGIAIANISVATSEKRKGEEITEWHKVTLFDKNAENAAKYLKKGSQVYVEGRIQTRSYEKDGVKQYTTEIVADRIVFLGSGKGDEQKQTESTDDVLPF
jgi:single-strand DNA-binding protein